MVDRNEVRSMKKKCQKQGVKKDASGIKPEVVSYRLKCAKTANGLSHFVMYGDVDKKEALL